MPEIPVSEATLHNKSAEVTAVMMERSEDSGKVLGKHLSG